MSVVALAIHLAGTGDHGFLRRLNLGYGLLKDGIASLVLESPYYGSRRPQLQVPTSHITHHSSLSTHQVPVIHLSMQVRSKLRHVSDLLLLGRTTIEETLCLLQWAHTNGYPRLCLSGLSMGGVHAIMATSLAHHEVACAALLAPHSAAEPFCHGLLWFGTSQKWTPERHLGPVPDNVNALQAARNRLERVLDITDTRHFPVPLRPDAAVFVAATSDLYVSRESVARAQAHWPGSELRCVSNLRLLENLGGLNFECPFMVCVK